MKFSYLINKLSPQVHSLTSNPELNPELMAIKPVDQAEVNTLSYIKVDKFAYLVAKTTVSVIILPLKRMLNSDLTTTQKQLKTIF